MIQMLVLVATVGVDYPIVYVRCPRDPNTNVRMADVFWPVRLEPGTDLVLRMPDGAEEVLVDSGGKGCVLDPSVSNDGKAIFFSWIKDLTKQEKQRWGMPIDGADIYKMDLETRKIARLTHQEFEPNQPGIFSQNPTSAAPGKYRLGYGIFNSGPRELGDGRIVFTSNRYGYIAPKVFTFPSLQIFVMDGDGKNVECITPMSLNSALHPVPLKNGSIMFSSYESQGRRDIRNWSLWVIDPDGTGWRSLFPAMVEVTALHWQAQSTNGMISVVGYYNLNNYGMGTLFGFPFFEGTPVGSPNPKDPSNPVVKISIYPYNQKFPFSPPGLVNLTPWSHHKDRPSDHGKVTQPQGAPKNDLLVVYSKGPVNRPFDAKNPGTAPDPGIYLLRGSVACDDPMEMVEIVNRPEYAEQQPVPVVSWKEIYGSDPQVKPELANDGTLDQDLPAGTPFGMVKTPTVFRRESAPAVGPDRDKWNKLDPFNAKGNLGSNWTTQGADAGLFRDEDIAGIRILQMEPQPHLNHGPRGAMGKGWYVADANERMRILGEMPVKSIQADGTVDTRIKFLLPADVPYTFALINKHGQQLTMAQTWHQKRGGEIQDCRGCHAHHDPAAAYAGGGERAKEIMLASFDEPAERKPTLRLGEDAPILLNVDGVPTFTKTGKPVFDVEYNRDIKPIFEAKCAKCHGVKNADAPMGLVLDDHSLPQFPLTHNEQPNGSNTYLRLAVDRRARFGTKPVLGVWKVNLSRTVRSMNSLRSLLAWKVLGERTDGWTNDSFPTEAKPGDRSTLPPGVKDVDCDIDFIGSIMPPPDSGLSLTPMEKGMIVRWIDLGCPVSAYPEGDPRPNYFTDGLRPTITLQSPRRQGAFDTIRFGCYDRNLVRSRISVFASWPIRGRAAGTDIADLFVENDWVWSLPLSPSERPARGSVKVVAWDAEGNKHSVERTFESPRETAPALKPIPSAAR